MTNIDDRVAAALDADDRAFLERLEDDRGMFRQMGDSLTGPLGGWAKFMFVISFALGAAIIYSIWQLFTVEGSRETIMWATATLGALTAQGFLKAWFFDRMNMITVLRELKRLELQLAKNSEEK